MTAGYSGTPLARKLGIIAGAAVFVRNAPANYRELLEPLPPDVRFVSRLSGNAALLHLFFTKSADLEKSLASLRGTIDERAAVWISWPKKGSGVASDITEDRIRSIALPLGFVDVKVCAVDETWSGLKLMIRRELRAARP